MAQENFKLVHPGCKAKGLGLLRAADPLCWLGGGGRLIATGLASGLASRDLAQGLGLLLPRGGGALGALPRGARVDRVRLASEDWPMPLLLG